MQKLPIRRKTEIVGYTLVDDDVYEKFKNYKLRPHFNGYVALRFNGKETCLHAVIMETQTGMHTDHINHDKWDNRRENLKVCTPKENQANRLPNKNSKSGFKGVTPFRDKYRVEYGRRYLGVFDTLNDARKVYDLFERGLLK